MESENKEECSLLVIKYDNLKLRAYLFGKRTHLVVDTGAGLSFISSETASEYTQDASPQPCKPFYVATANGNVICDSYLDASIKRDKYEGSVRLHILPTSSFKVLLGVDWLLKHKAKIEFAEDTITLRGKDGREHTLRLEPNSATTAIDSDVSASIISCLTTASKQCQLTLTEDLVIPPKSRLIAKCHANVNMVFGELHIARKLKKKGIRPIQGAEAVLTSIENITCVPIENNSEHYMWYEKNYGIGELRPIEGYEAEARWSPVAAAAEAATVEDGLKVKTKLPPLTAMDIPGLSKLDASIQQLALDNFNETREVWRSVKEEANGILPAAHLPPVSIHIKEGTKPINLSNYRLSPAKAKAAQSSIDAMLRDGVIIEQNSDWAFPMIVVAKRDSDGNITGARCCLDLRQLNLVLDHPQQFAMLPADELIQKVARDKPTYLSVMDQHQAFFQMPLTDEAAKIIGFTGPDGRHYTFCRVPFGLSISPQLQHQTMAQVIPRELNNNVAWLLDDVCISTRGDAMDHISKFFAVARRCLQYGITMSLKKLQFLREEAVFLGHAISRNGIRILDSRQLRMLDLKKPEKWEALNSLLATMMYEQWCIEGLGEEILVLREVAANAKVFRNWNGTHDEAFARLRVAIKNATRVHGQLSNVPFLLFTDGSHYGYGWRLAQKDPITGEIRNIRYGSKTWPCVTPKSATDLEIKGAYYSLEDTKPIVAGSKVFLFVDHKPILGVHRTNAAKHEELAEGMRKICEHRPEITWIPGKEMLLPDMLSRYHDMIRPDNTFVYEDADTPPKLEPVNDAVPAEAATAQTSPSSELDVITAMVNYMVGVDFPVSQQMVAAMTAQVAVWNEKLPMITLEMQKLDAYIVEIMKKFKRGRSALRRIKDGRQLEDDIEIVNEHVNLTGTFAIDQHKRLCVHNKPVLGTNLPLAPASWRADLKVVVPSHMARQMVETAHNSLGSGAHAGAPSLRLWLDSKYHIKGLKALVEDVTRTCPNCQSGKPPTTQMNVPLEPIDAPPARVMIQLDHLGPFKRTAGGNAYILTVRDVGSGHIHPIPVRDTKGSTTLRALAAHRLVYAGLPVHIVTDGFPGLSAGEFRKWLDMNEVAVSTSTAGRSQGNGAAENSNRQILSLLRTNVPDHDEWDLMVYHLTPALNARYSRTLGTTPNAVMFGCELRLTEMDESITLPFVEPIDIAVTATAQRDLAVENINLSRARNKSYWDKGKKLRMLCPGEKVLLNEQTKLTPRHKKLCRVWTGPYVVRKRLYTNVYRIKDMATRKTRIAHISKLRVFREHNKDDMLLREAIDSKRTGEVRAPSPAGGEGPGGPGTTSTTQTTNTPALQPVNNNSNSNNHTYSDSSSDSDDENNSLILSFGTDTSDGDYGDPDDLILEPEHYDRLSDDQRTDSDDTEELVLSPEMYDHDTDPGAEPTPLDRDTDDPLALSDESITDQPEHTVTHSPRSSNRIPGIIGGNRQELEADILPTRRRSTPHIGAMVVTSWRWFKDLLNPHRPSCRSVLFRFPREKCEAPPRSGF